MHSEEQLFLKLKQTPAISWPAFGLFLLGLTIITFASSMAIAGAISLWSGMLSNGFGLYLLFSIMHDALHRNVSTNSRLNEVFGRISLFLLIPAAPIEIARWAHFQHHRFTSSDQDPDNFIHHAKWWQIPYRWPNFDLYYLYIFLRKGGEERTRRARGLISAAAIFIATVTTLAYLGYGLEVLVLWILASRIGLAMVALVFVFLPHYPATVTAKENEYRATTIRQGWEWLLTPLFVYQNYHLIHHLFPTVPFYNYIKIWQLKYDELIAENPAIQSGFALTPIGFDSPDS
ncbi:MAG: fatty acid desaturase [Pseudomonadales bacterium]|nr:fatty acid desaturase [Pseudomonadales bacterium]